MRTGGVLMLVLMGAGFVAFLFGRDNFIAPSWLIGVTWAGLFPALLIWFLALMSFGPAAKRNVQQGWKVYPAALFGAALLAYLPVVIAGALADRINDAPFFEPAVLVAYQNGASKGNCKRQVNIRRASGDWRILCRSRIDVEEGIEPGAPVHLVGREGFLGRAIDAIRKAPAT